MLRMLPLAAACAAFSIGFAGPALSGGDDTDPHMKMFYPDGTIGWEDDREFDRQYHRMDKDAKGAKETMDSGRKAPDGSPSPSDGAVPNSAQ